jgi:hypothetical protein
MMCNEDTLISGHEHCCSETTNVAFGQECSMHGTNKKCKLIKFLQGNLMISAHLRD